MKKLICHAFVFAALSVVASGQAEKRFPGLSAMHAEILQAAKSVTPVPLPTWIPAGFRVEKIVVNLGTEVPIEKQRLEVVYSRRLRDGRFQRFAIVAGFEGLGDLPYDATSTVRSSVGTIELAYEPPDLDDRRRRLKNFAMTHWFNIGKTAFHYDGMYQSGPDNKGLAMISLADTQKVLESLQKF